MSDPGRSIYVAVYGIFIIGIARLALDSSPDARLIALSMFAACLWNHMLRRDGTR